MRNFDLEGKNDHMSDCYYAGQTHPYRTCHGDIITDPDPIYIGTEIHERIEQFHAADISSESWPEPETEPKQTGNYTAMVSRKTDGSDPLVQEPKT